eukprot:gene13706-16197_t
MVRWELAGCSESAEDKRDVAVPETSPSIAPQQPDSTPEEAVATPEDPEPEEPPANSAGPEPEGPATGAAAQPASGTARTELPLGWSCIPDLTHRNSVADPSRFENVCTAGFKDQGPWAFEDPYVPDLPVWYTVQDWGSLLTGKRVAMVGDSVINQWMDATECEGRRLGVQILDVVDVLVINVGLHYHDMEEYRVEMEKMAAQLDEWITEAPQQRFVIFRETSAQHFMGIVGTRIVGIGAGIVGTRTVGIGAGIVGTRIVGIGAGIVGTRIVGI